MRKVWMAGALAALLALGACDTGGSERTITAVDVLSEKPIVDANGHPLLLPNSDPGVAVFESELLRLVNDYRLALGLQPLIPVTNLGDAARAHARHMIDHRFVSHVSPEGLIAGDRLKELNVEWMAVSENIAAAYSTPQAVFDAWLQSPPHRSVIESDRFTHAGAGYSMDRNPTPDFPGVHYWAMLFLQR